MHCILSNVISWHVLWQHVRSIRERLVLPFTAPFFLSRSTSFRYITMESYPLPYHGYTVYVALFARLQNAAALRQRLVTASTLPADEDGDETLPADEDGDRERAAVDFAFVDAKMVRGSAQVLACVADPSRA